MTFISGMLVTALIMYMSFIVGMTVERVKNNAVKQQHDNIEVRLSNLENK